MEIKTLIKKMKNIYSSLIEFIDASDNSDDEFMSLIEVFDGQAILENKEEVQLLFQLISKLADNHHRTSDILDKLEKNFSIFNQRYAFTDFMFYSRLYKLYLENLLFMNAHH